MLLYFGFFTLLYSVFGFVNKYLIWLFWLDAADSRRRLYNLLKSLFSKSLILVSVCWILCCLPYLWTKISIKMRNFWQPGVIIWLMRSGTDVAESSRHLISLESALIIMTLNLLVINWWLIEIFGVCWNNSISLF